MEGVDGLFLERLEYFHRTGSQAFTCAEMVSTPSELRLSLLSMFSYSQPNGQSSKMPKNMLKERRKRCLKVTLSSH